MKLTAEQRKTRDDAFSTFEEQDETLRTAIEAYNVACQEAHAVLVTAQEAYNEAGETLTEVIHEIGADLRAAVEEKSEKWQEGDVGMQSLALAEMYENFEAETFNADEPMEVDNPEGIVEDMLADLPDDSSEL